MADGEEVLSIEEVQKYLQTYVLQDTKLMSPKFHITKSSNEGDNYISIVYRVTIEGVENGAAKKLELIVKTRRNIARALGDEKDISPRLFQREIQFYQEVLPVFQEIDKKHGGISVRCPFLYHANIEYDKELLIFGNLTSEGFVMAKSKLLDYTHMSLVFRCLAEFHAHSFLMRASNPTGFKKLKLKDHLYDKEDSWLYTEQICSYFETARNTIIKALADENEHYTERYQRFVDNLDEEMFDTIHVEQAEPYAVVIHGDLWTSNLLFKYDKVHGKLDMIAIVENGMPCDMRFLDFQLVRYASPAIDIVHLFFSRCAPDTRSKYYDQLIREYHDALSECLKNIGYDPDDLFPYTILCQHLKKFGKYAAGLATFTIPILFNDGDDKSIQNVFSQEALEEKLKTNSIFRNCVKAGFKDLVDKNYI